MTRKKFGDSIAKKRKNHVLNVILFFKMVLLLRIELGSEHYHCSVLPLNYRSERL